MSLEPDRRWSLTGQALERLLQRLGEEPEAAAREYEAIRPKLVGFFERRGILGSEALADETIDRVARRLDDGETIEHLKAYFYGVARHLALEWRRRQAQERAAIERQRPLLAADEASEAREARVACLESCLRELPPGSRDLIASYYRDDPEGRKRLAESLGMTYTTLKTRAHRIRRKLEECLRECLDARSHRDR